MCVIRVKTRVHLDGKREIIEERRYCASASAGQLCDRVDRRELLAERITLVESKPSSSSLSRRSTTDQSYRARPRTVLFQSAIPLNLQSPFASRTSDRPNARRSLVVHNEPRRRRADRDDVYEVLPEAPSPPGYTMEAFRSHTTYTWAPLQEASLEVYVPESEVRSHLEYTPLSPNSISQQTTGPSNRNSRIDSAYAPSEHAKSPSPARSLNPGRAYTSHHREEQYLDERLPRKRTNRYAYTTNTTARLGDIESDYERAQKDMDKMNAAMRHMSIYTRQSSGERSSSSQQKRAKKHCSGDSDSKYRRSLTDK